MKNTALLVSALSLVAIAVIGTSGSSSHGESTVPNQSKSACEGCSDSKIPPRNIEGQIDHEKIQQRIDNYRVESMKAEAAKHAEAWRGFRLHISSELPEASQVKHKEFASSLGAAAEPPERTRAIDWADTTKHKHVGWDAVITRTVQRDQDEEIEVVLRPMLKSESGMPLLTPFTITEIWRTSKSGRLVWVSTTPNATAAKILIQP